jgi:protein TonB
MKSILTILLFMAFGKSFAQTDSAQPHVADSLFYYNVEIHAMFPGGNQSWKRYVEKNIEYPSNEIMGIVVLQILVSTEGKVDSTKIISGPPELHKEAIRLVRKPEWMPGVQNGRKVNSWTTVTVTF